MSDPWKDTEAPTGPCWSCNAPNSPRYSCATARHRWYCCEETCGQAVTAAGPDEITWDDCHECQYDLDLDDFGDPVHGLRTRRAQGGYP